MGDLRTDIVRFPGGDHVWFDRTTRKMHCDRCQHEEELEAIDYQTDSETISVYAAAHRRCPESPSSEHKERVSKTVFDAAYQLGMGVPLSDVLAGIGDKLRA